MAKKATGKIDFPEGFINADRCLDSIWLEFCLIFWFCRLCRDTHTHFLFTDASRQYRPPDRGYDGFILSAGISTNAEDQITPAWWTQIGR